MNNCFCKDKSDVISCRFRTLKTTTREPGPSFMHCDYWQGLGWQPHVAVADLGQQLRNVPYMILSNLVSHGSLKTESKTFGFNKLFGAMCATNSLKCISLTETMSPRACSQCSAPKHLGAVSLTYLSLLREGFTPIFSATLSYGKSVSP